MTSEGILVNSSEFDGEKNTEAKIKIAEKDAENKKLEDLVNAKAEKYEKELKDLCQDIQEPIKVNENYSPVISQELIQDYCELLTNPSHRKKREEEWKSYQLKSHD